MLKAKCKDCDWKTKSEGSVYLFNAMQIHHDNTGHRVKMKGRKTWKP